MAITNLERRIRLSNFTPTDYDMISNNYRQQLLPILMESSEFVTALESKNSYVVPKKKLEAEASKLAAHSDPAISSCGKAILQFMVGSVQTIDDVFIAITSVILAGGIILTTCMTAIIWFLFYAVTVVPAATLIKALEKQYQTLDQQCEAWRNPMNNPKEKELRTYKVVTKNIMSHKNGISDINELSKLANVSEAVQDVIESDLIIPHETATVHEFCSVLRAVDERASVSDTSSEDVIALEMEIFKDLAPADVTYHSAYTRPIIESSSFGDDDGTGAFMTFESILREPLLSGEGLHHGIICIATDATNQNTILKFLNKYKETAKYEFTHESYSDIPIVRATGATLKFVANRCSGNSEIMEAVGHLDQMLGNIIDEAYMEVTEEAVQGGAPVVCANPSVTKTGFNPDPYNIGALTPFPVASRKVGSLICDICNAETDEELTEAILDFGRVSTIISECYTVSGNDAEGYVFMESGAGKAARRASDKAHQKFSKSATKDKTGGVGEAIKRTIDPMEKFIQKQYETLKEKDANERRNVILKGGAMPKVMRWVKRGIGILALGVAGKVIPAAAIVSGIIFIGHIATDKYLDKKERAKLLRELEDEIQICNEKIDDSRGDDNKQKKYELMRIRNQLTRTSEKIRLGLKY